MQEMKSQLIYLKEQKNNYKKFEKNLIKKLDLKEKEVNELKTIFNTNGSVKSQINSIFQDVKDDENSKEVREIYSYNEQTNMNKKHNRPKSLSLIEKKLSSYSTTIHKRNFLQNKSLNSRNLSKNNKNNFNLNKKKIEFKYKTIANIFTGSSTKGKNENLIKINHNINKPNFYYNYNSVNSLRGLGLDKSDSRSILSKIGISKSKIYFPEESSNSKHIIITNSKSKNEINTNKNKKEYELINSYKTKNKIMINYNTNIINTNVSLDKMSLKEKIKEIKKVIDQKLNEVTRNKKNRIRRTISAVYEKRSKSPFINNDKLKIRKDYPSFRFSNIFDDKSNSNSNKLDTKSNKHFKINKSSSNVFKPKIQNVIIQNKNNKKIKIKFKNKNNSMYDIKNNINGTGFINKNINKIYAIQAYTGKKPIAGIQLYKNNEKALKMKKNSSVISLNTKTSMSKFQNWETNNKNVRNNKKGLYITGLTYRKNNNINKISLIHEKLNKKNIKLKKNNFDINCSNNKINTSLRKLIFTKSISSSNVS